jgi:putative ABC transport system permease protein
MLLEYFSEILDVLRRNRLRTFLTALSVAWGMFILAVLLGAGRGLENGAEWEFRFDAIASQFIQSGLTSVPFAGHKLNREVKFMNEDREALARELPAIKHKTGHFYFGGEFQVIRGNQHSTFNVRGVHPDHQALEKTEMVRGRFINDLDVLAHRKICVIGTKVREALFGQEDPVGQLIKIRGLYYLVVGEFEDIGDEAEMRSIYVPITTAQLVYHSPRRIHTLMIDVAEPDLELSQRVEEQTHRILAARHQVANEDRRAIRIWNNLQRFHKITGVFVWLRVFVWIVGLGTLLAGVVGVSNIMLIAVAERRKELGIRRSLGATAVSIVGMIMTEAILLTAVSGYLGLIAGVGAVEWVARTFKDLPFLREPSVDVGVMLAASALVILAGAMAGLFPALRAARVDPITALREGD